MDTGAEDRISGTCARYYLCIMCSGRYAPLRAFGLGMLFLFMLIPADLLHEHASVQHDATAQDQIHGECSICDLVLPVQLNAVAPIMGLLSLFIWIRYIPHRHVVQDGVRIHSFSRGPPLMS